MPRAPANRTGSANRPSVSRSNHALILICGTVLVAALIGWYVVDRRRSDRELGIQLALSGKMTNAEPLLAEARRRDPHDVDVIRAQALGRIAAGQLTEATDPIERWCALRPGDPEPFFARIDQAVKLNRPAEAIEPARVVLSLRPQSEHLQRQIVYWLFLVGRTEEADRECQLARERFDNPELKLLHAEITRRLGDSKRSAQYLDELLKAGHRTPAALTLRGALELDAGQYAAAIASLREAVNRGGEGQSRARHFLSLALARNGEEDAARRILAEEQQHQAIGTWEKYGRLEEAGYLVVIAEGMLANGRHDEAFRLLQQALAKDSHCRSAHKLMADYYTTRGQLAEATDHRRKSLE